MVATNDIDQCIEDILYAITLGYSSGFIHKDVSLPIMKFLKSISHLSDNELFGSFLFDNYQVQLNKDDKTYTVVSTLNIGDKVLVIDIHETFFISYETPLYKSRLFQDSLLPVIKEGRETLGVDLNTFKPSKSIRRIFNKGDLLYENTKVKKYSSLDSETKLKIQSFLTEGFSAWSNKTPNETKDFVTNWLAVYENVMSCHLVLKEDRVIGVSLYLVNLLSGKPTLVRLFSYFEKQPINMYLYTYKHIIDYCRFMGIDTIDTGGINDFGYKGSISNCKNIYPNTIMYTGT
jgi:hypothetical protein